MGQQQQLVDDAKRAFQKTTPEERAFKSMDCSKVLVKPDTYGGNGAFAVVDIKKGELVEYGLMRRVPVDGNECPYVFTWSDDRTICQSPEDVPCFTILILPCQTRR